MLPKSQQVPDPFSEIVPELPNVDTRLEEIKRLEKKYGVPVCTICLKPMQRIGAFYWGIAWWCKCLGGTQDSAGKWTEKKIVIRDAPKKKHGRRI